MHPPFTADQFFDVFRSYNDGVWPAQLALIAAALIAALAAYRANVHRSWRWAQLVFVLLAALWLWTGIAYHKEFFARLTPAGNVFGSLCIAEAGLLLLCAWQSVQDVQPASKSRVAIGTLLIAYALLGYPLIGLALGHRYPAMPSFGTPCPTTIFTFGVFCLLPRYVPRFAVAFPVAWSILGISAATFFGVREDLALPVAAIAALTVIHHETHRPSIISRPVEFIGRVR